MKIEIEITNVQVFEVDFYFDYKIVNGENTLKEGKFKGDHSWEDRTEYKKVLEEGEAINILLQEKPL